MKGRCCRKLAVYSHDYGRHAAASVVNLAKKIVLSLQDWKKIPSSRANGHNIDRPITWRIFCAVLI
jgi:hypothetical protein